MGKIKKIGGKILYGASKEVTRFLAPLTAIASTAGKEGNGITDNLKAVYHVPHQIYEVGKAFVQNEGIRTFFGNRANDLTEIVGDTIENCVERPLETIGVAAGVYTITRFAPQLIKGASKLFKKKSVAEQYVTHPSAGQDM
jgi:hypothetical protein